MASAETTPATPEGGEPLREIPLVHAEGITKRFPGVVALKNVRLTVYKGEVHAILGENGAGKSTLVKILYGIYAPDEGEIFVEGKKTVISSPADAIRNGIVLVSQSPQLIDRLTVGENMLLSLAKFGSLSRKGAVRKIIEEHGEKVGIKVDPDIEVWKLTYTQKQLAEILRALVLGAKLLMLDEATTFLPLLERKRLYKYMRYFADQGGSVILITHKIPEAVDVADKVTVLRRGEVVGTIDLREIKDKKEVMTQIRKMMFGEKAETITYQKLPPGKPREEAALKVEKLQVIGDYGALTVRGVSLEVKKGEVVGIAGIAGNGQKELVQAIMGLRKVKRGKVLINGLDVTNKGTSKVRALGVGFIPDIPTRFGVSIENTMVENLAMHPLIAKGFIRWGRMKELAKKLIDQYRILIPSPTTPVKYLSGGNLMKVLVAREMLVSKSLLIAYNPTRALDEVTASMVRKLMKQKAVDEGIGVLLVSEDLDEIFMVSDRIAVINSGRILKVFPSDVDRETVESLMVSG